MSLAVDRAEGLKESLFGSFPHQKTTHISNGGNIGFAKLLRRGGLIMLFWTVHGQSHVTG